MIIVIVNKERDKHTGKIINIVSHGIDLEDEDRVVVLPQEPPEWIGAKFDTDLLEWVIDPDYIDEKTKVRSIYKC